MKPKFSEKWNFISLLTAVFIIGLIITIYVSLQIKTNTENTLLMRTNTIAQLLEIDNIVSLSGNETDLESPRYQKLKIQLRQTVIVNPDVRFIYLTGKKGNDLFFFVDSEPADSTDYSPPGQVYYEASNKFRDVFINKKSIIEGINTDRWGTWISALTPIIDPDTNQVIAVAGMDIDANEYIRTIAVYSLLPALTTLFLLTFISINFILKQREIKRMTLKAELVSIAGHEIRSPLVGVIWQMEDLLKNLTDKLTESQIKTLHILKDNCKNLLKTTNDLLDLYALENTKRETKVEPVEVSSLISETADGFQLTAKEKTVQIVTEPGLNLYVLADKDKFKRMLNNLLSNAIKYSKTGGTVKISCEENINNCIIKVADSGIGIPDSDKEKIFKGFYRAANARQIVSQGTGLGLYYVKQIVNLYHGKIRVESKENSGTTFSVEFPKYQKPAKD